MRTPNELEMGAKGAKNVRAMSVYTADIPAKLLFFASQRWLGSLKIRLGSLLY